MGTAPFQKDWIGSRKDDPLQAQSLRIPFQLID